MSTNAARTRSCNSRKRFCGIKNANPVFLEGNKRSLYIPLIMRAAFRKLWQKLIRAEKKAEEFAVHEAEVVAHAAEEAVHAVEEVVYKVEKMTVRQVIAMTNLAQRFLRLEAGGGIVLMATTVMA